LGTEALSGALADRSRVRRVGPLKQPVIRNGDQRSGPCVHATGRCCKSGVVMLLGNRSLRTRSAPTARGMGCGDRGVHPAVLGHRFGQRPMTGNEGCSAPKIRQAAAKKVLPAPVFARSGWQAGRTRELLHPEGACRAACRKLRNDLDAGQFKLCTSRDCRRRCGCSIERRPARFRQKL